MMGVSGDAGRSTSFWMTILWEVETGASGFEDAADIAVDGALFVAGGAVFFLGGDGCEIGDVVFRGHGDGAEEVALKGRVAVEGGAALGVDVEDVEGGWCCGFFGPGEFGELGLGKLGFDAA